MKKLSLTGWQKKTWKVFSQYIRLKYANKDGFVRCVTCGKIKHWKEMQAGHYKHNKLDFCEFNVFPQCVRCNHYKSGELGNYADFLIKKFGNDILEKIEIYAKLEKKYNIIELQYMHDEWKKIVKKFKEKIGE